jgi:exodeoxyribonuclease V alpha subunit
LPPALYLRLTEVFRQATQSRIITSAHRINQGLIPDLSKPEGDGDVYFVQADDPETVMGRIIELVKSPSLHASGSIPFVTSRCCAQ